MLGHIAALTPADVAAVASEELAPTREAVICSGPRKTLEAAFQEAGVAEGEVDWIDER